MTATSAWRIKEPGAREKATADASPPCPLLVDVDGCLVRTDLLWEGLVQLVITRPRRLWGTVPALFAGKAALKAYVARHGAPNIETLPLHDGVLALMREARASGRPVHLVSGAHMDHVHALSDRVGADGAVGSDGTVNLTGKAKLRAIQQRFSAFDYVGDGLVDLPLWRAARRSYVAGSTPWTRWIAQRSRADLIHLKSSSSLVALWRGLRVHQWVKNLLLLLAPMAAHLPLNLALGGRLLAGVAAFSLTASAVYLLNDVIDLEHDRRHETKRHRPLASGQLSIPAGIVAALVLVAAAAVIAATLPREFQVFLLGYAGLTTAYSVALKRIALLDVVTLATLYTLRIVAGAALVGVPLTRWFLGFAIFFFFSLALVKRAVELQSQAKSDRLVPGRGYRAADLPVIVAFGAGAAMASSLVYCLYITGPDAARLYARPDWLWAGLPVFLYWIARVWLLTVRGEMREDPVVFALRDRLSGFALVLFLLIIAVAAR